MAAASSIRAVLKIRGYTVAQFPNAPLIVALAAAAIGWVASGGSALHDAARAVLYVALTVWAWEEAARGVNGFRRLLGVAGLAYVAVALARAFG